MKKIFSVFLIMLGLLAGMANNVHGTEPDSDGDGVPDSSDICAAGDDTIDTDNDGIPDSCDISPGSDLITLAAGGNHTLSLKTDGTVWAWGGNDKGQLGDGTTIDKAVPVQVSGLTNIVGISAGGRHSLALKNDGTLWAWGSNSWGQLGDGSGTAQSIPVQVFGMTNVVDFSAGAAHNMVIKDDGTVWAWGSNYCGELGIGSGPISRTIPGLVSTLTNTVDVECGGGHSLALKDDGTVWFMGHAGFEQHYLSPIQLSGLTDVIDIAAGGGNSFAQKNDGTLWTLVPSVSEAVQVTGIINVIDFDCGVGHCMALKTDGTLWAWGGNSWGQLGDGSTAYKYPPVQVSGLTNVIDFAVGNDHNVAQREDGTVWSFGYNFNGQMGDGTGGNSVVAPDWTSHFVDFVKVAAGEFHSIAIKDGGTVWTWGYNEDGQLGDGTEYYPRWTPNQVSGLVNVVEVSGGNAHSLALKDDGTIWEWGLGTTLPVQVSALANAIGIAAGDQHSLAIKNDGTLWAWGLNFQGQLVP